MLNRIFLSADIEGTCGIAHWDETELNKPDYEPFRRQMTREVAAACEGALAAGSEDILIKDAHDSARNLLPGELPLGVQIFRGWGSDIHSMVSGLDASFACETFTRDDVEQIKPLLASAKILLAQLEVNQDANELVVDYAKGQGARVVLNPAPIHAVSSEFLCKADVITPNEVEASALSGIPIKTPDDALRAAGILMDKGVKSVVITLGKQGVLAVMMLTDRISLPISE